MRTLYAAIILVASACSLVAQTPRKVSGPGEIKVDKGDWSEEIELSGADVDDLRYTVTGQKLRAIRVWAPDNKTVRLVLGGKLDETGYLTVATAKGNKVHELYAVKIVVGTGGGPPGPVDPPKPPPIDPPTPPQPPVPVDPPPPIAGDGFKVMIVYERTLQQKLTADQLLAIQGQRFRDYMAGKNGQYLIVDKDENIDVQPKEWKDAMARPRTSLPWLLISNGKTGYEGPLPTTKAEINALLIKHGGN